MPKPIRDKIKGLRQRQRTDGSWAVWWEPNKSERALGFKRVDLWPDYPAKSIREAERLNDDAAGVRAGKPRRTKTGSRSIDALIKEYLASPRFQNRKPATQRGYRDNLRLIARKWGPDQVADFDEYVLEVWLQNVAKHSGAYQAHALKRMMSILFSFAERLRWIPKGSNPCKGEDFELPVVKGRSRRSSWEEYDHIMTTADKLGRHTMRLAIALAIFTGQRREQIFAARIEDFRKFSFGHNEGDARQVWTWHLDRTKRDTQGVIPIHHEVEPLLDAAIEAAGPDQKYLLIDEATGRVMSRNLFSKRWARIRAEAAKTMPSLINKEDRRKTLQFRDLRRTMASWGRRGGASKDDVTAVLGNTAAADWELGETYMPQDFWTALRAIDAIRRPDKDDDARRSA